MTRARWGCSNADIRVTCERNRTLAATLLGRLATIDAAAVHTTVVPALLAALAPTANDGSRMPMVLQGLAAIARHSATLWVAAVDGIQARAMDASTPATAAAVLLETLASTATSPLATDVAAAVAANGGRLLSSLVLWSGTLATAPSALVTAAQGWARALARHLGANAAVTDALLAAWTRSDGALLVQLSNSAAPSATSGAVRRGLACASIGCLADGCMGGVRGP